MKKILALLFLAVPCLGSGPKYISPSAEPDLYQEFVNSYHDLANPIINVGQASTMTVTQLNVSTITMTGTRYVVSDVPRASAVSVSVAGQFVNITSISLGSGNWDVSGIVLFLASGVSATNGDGAISIFSGNTTTDHVEGDNWMEPAIPNIGLDQPLGVIPSYRLALSATTTVYLKGSTSTTPQKLFGRISAVKAL